MELDERAAEAPDPVRRDRRPAAPGDPRRDPCRPASQLRQDALADTYGVSRIPVREALFQLEAEGLVRIVPHKGAIVSELSLDEINDVFDLRGDSGAAHAGAVGAALRRRPIWPGSTLSRRVREGDRGARRQPTGVGSMPISTWRSMSMRGSRAPRRSSRRCCRPATAIRGVQLSNTNRHGDRRAGACRTGAAVSCRAL